jgi:LPS export ABC transporter protein LptC
VKCLPAFLLLSLLLLTACEEKVRPAVAPGMSPDIPSQESWNSTVTFTDSAHLRAVLWSGHISVYTPREYTLLDESVRVDFYNEFEQHTSVLTARRGKVNDRTRDFEAYDNVVVVSDSGTVLKTDRLFWTNATRLIHTDAFVEITSPNEQIRGHGMESDQSLKNYRIFRVTGRAVTHD